MKKVENGIVDFETLVYIKVDKERMVIIFILEVVGVVVNVIILDGTTEGKVGTENGTVLSIVAVILKTNGIFVELVLVVQIIGDFEPGLNHFIFKEVFNVSVRKVVVVLVVPVRAQVKVAVFNLDEKGIIHLEKIFNKNLEAN